LSVPEPEPAFSAATPVTGSLRQQRPFVYFSLARFGGTLANQMLMVALAWNMYALTSSAWDLGLVGLFQFGAAFLLTLPAGHVADRVHRSRLFAACMVLQVLVALALMAAAAHDLTSRTLLLGMSLLLGAARAFQMPSQQALVPQLVRPDQLQRALSVNSAALQAAIIGGPALGGALYAHGVTTVYAVACSFFLLASIAALCVRYAHEPANSAASWHSVFDGVRFVWNQKIILGATTLDLFAVLLGGATALLPIYARDILHTGPAGLGVLRGAPAAGSLCMSLALVRWPLQRNVGKKLLWAVALFGLSTLVFGLSQSFWLSLVALAISGAADTISVVTRSNLVQLETPNAMRGRVAAVNSIFIGASNQLGEFESGSVAAVWGPEASVVSGGIGTVLIAALWFRWFPSLAQRDRMGQS
jgi:MFS family permease